MMMNYMLVWYGVFNLNLKCIMIAKKWMDAFFVVKRNSIRRHINQLRIRHISLISSNPVFIFCSIDVKARDETSISKSLRRHLFNLNEDQTAKLPSISFVVEGMSAVITENIYTELGICNGTICFVKKVVFCNEDLERKPQVLIHEKTLYVLLRRLPKAIVLSVEDSKHSDLSYKCPKLKKNEVILKPTERSFRIKVLVLH